MSESHFKIEDHPRPLFAVMGVFVIGFYYAIYVLLKIVF